jgi:hypothetical protein
MTTLFLDGRGKEHTYVPSQEMAVPKPKLSACAEPNGPKRKDDPSQLRASGVGQWAICKKNRTLESEGCGTRKSAQPRVAVPREQKKRAGVEIDAGPLLLLLAHFVATSSLSLA